MKVKHRQGYIELGQTLPARQEVALGKAIARALAAAEAEQAFVETLGTALQEELIRRQRVRRYGLRLAQVLGLALVGVLSVLGGVLLWRYWRDQADTSPAQA